MWPLFVRRYADCDRVFARYRRAVKIAGRYNSPGVAARHAAAPGLLERLRLDSAYHDRDIMWSIVGSICYATYKVLWLTSNASITPIDGLLGAELGGGCLEV